MKVADYLVDYLIKVGVTDIFGIPGGVLLDFVYALNDRKEEIKTHLLYHEQNAGFAAIGYAQSTQKIGVAFGTKGPGILNLTTSIAEAYYDSVPSLFITAHSLNDTTDKMRTIEDQEMNILPIFSTITKYCTRVDDVDNFVLEINKCINIANSGRKGPVVIDISSKIWNYNVIKGEIKEKNIEIDKRNEYKEAIVSIEKNLKISKKPLILIGDGIRQAGIEKEIIEFLKNNKIPAIYSRGSQDIMATYPDMAFGYVGSHGIRYANFILSEADLLISFGNRMSFPINSKSFLDIFNNCKLIRCDIDKSEFIRKIPNSENFQCDIKDILKEIATKKMERKNEIKWLKKCNKIKKILWTIDTETPVKEISQMLNIFYGNTGAIVGDVGNNEFWLSRAYELSNNKNKILFSRSFGTMGNSIGKAIGAYFGLNKSIVCFIGDQGLQMNPQELQFISKNKLPIHIVVINNSSSGMIKSRQIKKYNSRFLLTTKKTGYSVVDLKKLSDTYNFQYIQINSTEDIYNKLENFDYKKPLFIDFIIDESIDLEISLPIGNNCKNMEPKLRKGIFKELEKL